jgi:Tol biopolymer transport system component
MLHRLSQLEAAPVRGTANARTPFFSPDGRWIGYYDVRTRDIRKVAVDGGGATSICQLAEMMITGASWAPDDTIVFATGAAGTGLMRVSAHGGVPIALTKPDAAKKESSHRFPSLLPGGRAVLFAIVTEGSDDTQVAVLDLSSGQSTVLVSGSGAEYVETGHLLYVSGRTLHAIRFDPDRLELRGAPMPIVEDIAVARGVQGAPQYSVSRTGTLVYVPASAMRFASTSLVWVNRTGHESPVGAPERAYYSLRLSPDGGRVALDVREGQYDTWILDLNRLTLDKVTSSPRNDPFPVWSPDGRRVVTGDGPGLVWRAADGSGADEPLTTSSQIQFPMSFSPDGRLLVLTEVKGGHNDLSVLTMDGTREVKPLAGLHTLASEGPAEISPDGRWLAYQSNESGENHIYVRPFPDASQGRYTVSPNGGTHPAWAREGRELYYIDASGMLTAVAVEPGQTFQIRGTTPLFSTTSYVASGQSRSYDVRPGREHFLFIKDANVSTGPTIVVVLNWHEELKQRVPTR